MQTLRLVAAVLLLPAARAQAMFPPTAASQVGLSSLPRGLGGATHDGLGASILIRDSDRSKLRSGRAEAPNPSGEHSRITRATLLLDWRLSRRLTGVLAMPYVRNRARVNGNPQSADGPGDLALLAKFAAYQDHSFLPKELLIIAGVELPTGFHDAKDSSGARLPLSQQPGSDSTDWILGLAGVWAFWDASVFADATYKLNGRETYTFGDALGVNLGASASLPLFSALSLSGEFNGEFARRDRSRLTAPGVLADGRVGSTGGETLFFSPSIQWRPAPRFSAALGAQVPVYQNLRGTQLQSGINLYFSASARFPGTGPARRD